MFFHFTVLFRGFDSLFQIKEQNKSKAANLEPGYCTLFKALKCCSVWLLGRLTYFSEWMQSSSHKEGCGKRECAPICPSSEVYHNHMKQLLGFFVQTTAQGLGNLLFNGLIHFRFHMYCFQEYVCISQHPGTALLLPCGVCLVWFDLVLLCPLVLFYFLHVLISSDVPPCCRTACLSQL